MPKFFMLGIALFLVLAAAGYGLTTIQARSIPWDCTDWQAFAHANRTTSILESLAENRGKTLYCGVDQSRYLYQGRNLGSWPRPQRAG